MFKTDSLSRHLRLSQHKIVEMSSEDKVGMKVTEMVNHLLI